MKEYLVWFETNTNPPNNDGVFILDTLKGRKIKAASLEEAKQKAVEIEKEYLATCNETGQCRLFASID